MARHEKTYQSELKRSFDKYLRDNDLKGIYFKICDTGYTKKPYDSWCLVGGKYYAMEQKINKSVGTFNFKEFFRGREHELTALEKVEHCGGKSYVTINHYVLRKKINTAYAIPIGLVLYYHERGSIKLDEIKAYTIEIPRIKGSLWDLTKLFN